MEGENLLEQGQLRTHRSVDIDPERSSTIPDASGEILEREVACDRPFLLPIRGAGDFDVVGVSTGGGG
jgi:hypothetical protein